MIYRPFGYASISLRKLSERQGWRCCYCGVRTLLPKDRAGKRPWNCYSGAHFGRSVCARRCTYEHVIPRSQGGTDDEDNLAAACHWCNNFRGDHPWEIATRVIGRFVLRGSHPHIRFEKTGLFAPNGYNFSHTAASIARASDSCGKDTPDLIL